jgi:DNA-binding GntR family transcriptional regulator
VKAAAATVSSRPAVHRARLSGAAYQLLKVRLLDGDFTAGETIKVDVIVREVGGSRQPVMEALKQLAAEGFLEIIPQVGCRVVAPAHEQIHDFFVLVAHAEGFCAQLAAERASDLERKALAAVMDGGVLPAGRASGTEIAHAYRLHNRQFHTQIHLIAHSHVVSAIALGLWDRSDFFISTAVGMRPFRERAIDAVEEHRRIQRAICAGRAVEARELMQRHIEGFRTEMARPRAAAARKRVVA